MMILIFCQLDCLKRKVVISVLTQLFMLAECSLSYVGKKINGIETITIFFIYIICNCYTCNCEISLLFLCELCVKLNVDSVLLGH